MTPTKIVVDCATGAEQAVPLTPEEQAELDARVPVPMPEPQPSADERLADLPRHVRVGIIAAKVKKVSWVAQVALIAVIVDVALRIML